MQITLNNFPIAKSRNYENKFNSDQKYQIKSPLTQNDT